MPETTSATSSILKSVRPVGRGAELKWLSFLAAMLVAIVIDGISVSDPSKLVSTVSNSEQAAITLPSDHCGPGCAIMVASNQGSDRIQ